ncbi:MAG: pyridoxal phosphate-dependent aminotransferase [Desulfurococcales archaeon]|nr:pyridoxal phosphate-dependent aminotransferase [Desulfurococcales archaeon]
MGAPVLGLKKEMYDIKGETAFQFLAIAKELERKGRKIISFGIGQPDFPTPKHIVEAAIQALREGFTGYTETAGIPELREAIAWYLNSRYNAGVDPDEILATTGAKTALFIGMAGYLRPGDEVIVPDPSYYAYAMTAKFFGARPVYVPMKFEPGYGFSLDIEEIRSKINDRTRMIVVNNPHNPTGSIFTPDQIGEIFDIAQKHDLILLFDEIYDNFVFEEGKFKSILEYDGWKDYVLYVNGFSKTFSMTGWRLGYIVSRKEVIDRFKDLAVTVYSCPTSFVQKAGIAALKGDWEPVRRMIEEFKARSILLHDILSEAWGFETYRPLGAFYMFPRVRKLLDKTGMTVEELTNKLLYDYGIVVLPGTSFPGNTGRDYVRLSFATSKENIEEGARIIVKASRELAGMG